MNIMKANKELNDFDALLDEVVGKVGTEARDDLEQRAQTFCIGQIISDARKQEKMTQSELAQRVGTNKSYISKIEHGSIEPSASLFLRIITALGLKFEIQKAVYTIS